MRTTHIYLYLAIFRQRVTPISQPLAITIIVEVQGRVYAIGTSGKRRPTSTVLQAPPLLATKLQKLIAVVTGNSLRKELVYPLHL